MLKYQRVLDWEERVSKQNTESRFKDKRREYVECSHVVYDRILVELKCKHRCILGG